MEMSYQENMPKVTNTEEKLREEKIKQADREIREAFLSLMNELVLKIYHVADVDISDIRPYDKNYDVQRTFPVDPKLMRQVTDLVIAFDGDSNYSRTEIAKEMNVDKNTLYRALKGNEETRWTRYMLSVFLSWCDEKMLHYAQL